MQKDEKELTYEEHKQAKQSSCDGCIYETEGLKVYTQYPCNLCSRIYLDMFSNGSDKE